MRSFLDRRSVATRSTPLRDRRGAVPWLTAYSVHVSVRHLQTCTMYARREAQAMKAITQQHYGSEEVLELREISTPAIGDGEVLVRVHASSIHIGDRLIMTGRPYVMRMATGVRRPKQ